MRPACSPRTVMERNVNYRRHTSRALWSTTATAESCRSDVLADVIADVIADRVQADSSYLSKADTGRSLICSYCKRSLCGCDACQLEAQRGACAASRRLHWLPPVNAISKSGEFAGSRLMPRLLAELQKTRPQVHRRLSTGSFNASASCLTADRR